ncbi:hypothetical protein SBRCBS47491_006371 [Sporothrix bragantina]|uniref:Transcription factor TFIIIC triple barrel domain-containing protein n=1 Tax=Sporothrix bragantina TaxID=671064 RepID=A0ABP0C5M8_9PEZI
MATATIDAMEDADDDWEYEYSTTETETYLVSLDLSLPEFVRRRDDLVVHNTRGGFRSWLNPMNLGGGGGGASNTSKGGLHKGLGGDDQDADGDGDNGDNDGELAEDSDNDEHGHDTRNQQSHSQQQQPEEPDPTEIQILDLHDAEPLISYRGMLFKGAWSQIIGTEMVFAGRADDAPEKTEKTDKAEKTEKGLGTPVSSNVDLVGATAARIACTPVEVRPFDGSLTAKKLAKPKGETTPGGLGFVIPVGNAASVPRQQQAHFLEQLMAIKHQHGEPDVVTVQALDTKQNAVHGDAEEAKRRARRETLLQVHQERRAKRLREAETAEGTPSGTPTGTPTATPRRVRRSRRGMSPLATVAGDDELAGVAAREVAGNREQDDANSDSERGE